MQTLPLEIQRELLELCGSSEPPTIKDIRQELWMVKEVESDIDLSDTAASRSQRKFIAQHNFFAMKYADEVARRNGLLGGAGLILYYARSDVERETYHPY